MSKIIIEKTRRLVTDGGLSLSGLTRALGLPVGALRDITDAQWAPTAPTLAKLERFFQDEEDVPVLVPIEEIIEEARNGRMFILVDDEDRENEGDLVIPAQMATPDAVNFMATHGRGLVCLALTRTRAEQLGLELMSRNNGTRHETAFTVSIEAREGVTTGISAGDRARTVAVAIDASKGLEDIVTPGHVFPLIARNGGVLVRAGHTEAAVDISRLAGLNPSGVICEIMKEDGTMARMDDLVPFARKHGLKMGTIRDLIEYRRRNDHLVECIGHSPFRSDYGGDWTIHIYRNKVDGTLHLVLQKGAIVADRATLVRVHGISILSDILGQAGPRKQALQRAMVEIGKAGAGLVVLLVAPDHEQFIAEVRGDVTPTMDLRSYGIGAQILADMGVRDLILLTNTDVTRNIVGIDGYGLAVVGQHVLPVENTDVDRQRPSS